MPFKMMGKSPLTKKLVGKQGNLPENLKAAIKAAPGKMVSPLKNEITEADKAKARKSLTLTPQQAADARTKQSQRRLADQKFKAGSGVLLPENQKFKGLTGSQIAGLENVPKTTPKKKTTSGGDRFAKAYEIAKKKYPKAYGKMNLAEYTAEAKRQIANRKKTGKYIGGTKKPASESAATTTTTTKPPKVGFSVGAASASLGGKRQGGTPGFSTVKVGGSGGAKATFGKKVINRGSSFTDEYGNTYDRSVKGRKKADGSVSKTISNKTNNVTTREKDVTKGAKVKGQRRAKTVTKTKFDRKGDVRKVVTRTRGKGRKVLSDADAKKKTEQLKEMRKKRDESPTKMKTKTPSKMMKKAPSKMMKKAPSKMMKKAPVKMMKKKK